MSRRKGYPGHIEKRAGSFRVHLCVAGKRYKYTLMCSKREAEQFARDRFEKLKSRARRRAVGLPGTVRISELLERYENDRLPMRAPGTQRSYRDSLKPIREYFVKLLHDPEVDEISAGHINEFLDWRRVHDPHGRRLSRPLANRSLAKDRAVLHKIFREADRWELREGNPVSRTDAPKGDKRDPVILKDEEFERLLAACERPMLKLYVLTLNETGMRCESEALHLHWSDVDLESGFIWIDSSRQGHRTKSGSGRWVPMTQRLREAMKEHFARYRFATYDEQPTDWMFHHTRRWRDAEPGDRVKTMRKAFRGACNRAKLPEGFVQHDLRHRRVTTWLAAEKSPALVQRAMGHSDIRTTMDYMKWVQGHLRPLVEDVKELVDDEPGHEEAG